MPADQKLPTLTTTSYALLGLLRRGPLSAYELTGYLRRSALAHLWPRAEAGIYREPRHLVAHGYAEANAERTGGRTRTVYRITPTGRRALSSWLAVPGRPLRTEVEAAVKAFFADGGELASLRANLRAVAEHRPVPVDEHDPMIEGWLAGQLTYPEQLHYTAMAADLIGRLNRAAVTWAEEWLERTDSWSGTALDEVSEAQARAVLEEELRG